jgi:hypothetical protein
MKAIVRRFLSPDADPYTFEPEDANDVGVLVQMIVGPATEPGEESFDVLVCTPRWIDEQVQKHGPQSGRFLYIVDSWNSDVVLAALTEAVESEEGQTWADLAGKIGRIGKWEFEDYRP